MSIIDRTRPPAAAPALVSPFGTGHYPRRRALIVLISALAGFLLTVIWSAEFVDQTIGDNIANTLLGHDAKETPIAGIAAGIAFAFVSGLAGSFTACNIAAFGAVAPMLGEGGGRWAGLARALKPLGWMAGNANNKKIRTKLWDLTIEIQIRGAPRVGPTRTETRWW